MTRAIGTGVVVAAAELEAAMLSASTDVIDAVVVALPDTENSRSDRQTSIAIACLVLPENSPNIEGGWIAEELTNQLKKVTRLVVELQTFPASRATRTCPSSHRWPQGRPVPP